MSKMEKIQRLITKIKLVNSTMYSRNNEEHMKIKIEKIRAILDEYEGYALFDLLRFDIVPGGGVSWNPPFLDLLCQIPLSLMQDFRNKSCYQDLLPGPDEFANNFYRHNNSPAMQIYFFLYAGEMSSYLIKRRAESTVSHLVATLLPYIKGNKNVLGRGYVRCETSRDGDCGFVALNTTRKEAYNDLSRSFKGNQEARSLLSLVVLEQINTNPDFIPYLVRQKVLVSEAEVTTDVLAAACSKSVAAISAYLNYDLRDAESGKAVHPHVLQALACIKGDEFHIWTLAANKTLVPHKAHDHHYIYIPDHVTEPKRYDLLFVDGSHFERLELHGFGNDIPEHGISPVGPSWAEIVASNSLEYEMTPEDFFISIDGFQMFFEAIRGRWDCATVKNIFEKLDIVFNNKVNESMLNVLWRNYDPKGVSMAGWSMLKDAWLEAVDFSVRSELERQLNNQCGIQEAVEEIVVSSNRYAMHQTPSVSLRDVDLEKTHQP